MLSYVMIGCKGDAIRKTKQCLERIGGVTEVHGIYGVNSEADYAFMVEARVTGNEELDDIVFRGIQSLPEVVMTRTFAALDDAPNSEKYPLAHDT